MGSQEQSPGGAPTVFFDPALAGRRVQADGGAAALGTQFPSRETFEGTLTGRRLDDGDPPWRWVEIGQLTDKPLEFDEDAVWCEESYVYYLDHAAE
jgi:hypothetical protein